MVLFFYFTKELVFPILLATGIIVSIMLMDQIYKIIPFVQATGVNASFVLSLVFYSIPTLLVLASPLGLMIGTYIGIQRGSADYEITAMRAAGISLSFLFKPVLFVSSLVALLVLVFSFFLSPISITKTEELKFNALKTHAKINLSPGKINNFFGQKLIYIFEKEEDDLLKGVLITDWKNPNQGSIIEATQGRISFDEGTRNISIQLKQGKIHNALEGGGYQLTEFQDLDYYILPPQRDQKNLPKRFRDSSKKRQKMDIAMTSTELLAAMESPDTPDDNAREYRDEFHARIVTVLSCISFALFALPMSIFDPRNPKAGKLMYMLLMIVVYFALFTQARSLFVKGRIHPISLYAPLVLALGVGLVNFLKINYDLSSLKELFRLRK